MRSWQRGDTIIEVLVAVTVFSLVAVGATTIMNNGMAMSQRALEITQSRQQIDSQAELLRYLHDRAKENPDSDYGTLWQNLVDSGPAGKLVTTPHQFIGNSQCTVGSAAASKMFALTSSNDPTQPIRMVSNYTAETATFAKFNTGADRAEGLSIQLVRVQRGGNAYDAHIQACWDSPGSSSPATIGTIVRMYDPEA